MTTAQIVDGGRRMMTIAEQLKSDDEQTRRRALRALRPRRERTREWRPDGRGVLGPWLKVWIAGQLHELPPPEWIEFVPEPTWLERIQALQPGDACEFEYPASPGWRPGVVVENGGSGYWRIEPVGLIAKLRGDGEACVHIEQVRLPHQVEAWPLRSVK